MRLIGRLALIAFFGLPAAFARTYHPGDTLPALESFTKGN